MSDGSQISPEEVGIRFELDGITELNKEATILLVRVGLPSPEIKVILFPSSGVMHGNAETRGITNVSDELLDERVSKPERLGLLVHERTHETIANSILPLSPDIYSKIGQAIVWTRDSNYLNSLLRRIDDDVVKNILTSVVKTRHVIDRPYIEGVNISNRALAVFFEHATAEVGTVWKQYVNQALGNPSTAEIPSQIQWLVGARVATFLTKELKTGSLRQQELYNTAWIQEEGICNMVAAEATGVGVEDWKFFRQDQSKIDAAKNAQNKLGSAARVKGVLERQGYVELIGIALGTHNINESGQRPLSRQELITDNLSPDIWSLALLEIKRQGFAGEERRVTDVEKKEEVLQRLVELEAQITPQNAPNLRHYLMDPDPGMLIHLAEILSRAKSPQGRVHEVEVVNGFSFQNDPNLSETEKVISTLLGRNVDLSEEEQKATEIEDGHGGRHGYFVLRNSDTGIWLLIEKRAENHIFVNPFLFFNKAPERGKLAISLATAVKEREAQRVTQATTTTEKTPVAQATPQRELEWWGTPVRQKIKI